MANFKIAYDSTVKKWEGDYDTDPDDKGNWSGGIINVGYITGTKCGLIAADFIKVYGHTPTPAEMKNLTQEQIYHIYTVLYWNYINGDAIANQDLANQLFDIAVNLGKGDALKYAKQITNEQESTSFDDSIINKLNGAV